MLHSNLERKTYIDVDIDCKTLMESARNTLNSADRGAIENDMIETEPKIIEIFTDPELLKATKSNSWQKWLYHCIVDIGI
jgi:hypothetical protein